MKKIWRWGIIAPGKIAEKFASDLKLVEGTKLYAVASRNIEKAKEFSYRNHADMAYGSYQELAMDPNVDVVYVASPHTFHYEHVLLCLQNGKHVLCEKPIGINALQVENLASIAAQQNLFLMEALWTKFTPSFIKCYEIVHRREIGDVKYIQANFCFKAEYDVSNRLFSKRLGGGSLLDIGIYPVFLALELAGKPDSILASAAIGNTGVDETCNIILTYHDKEISAQLLSSILVDAPTEAIIAGTKGYIRLHSRWHEPTNLDVFIDGQLKHFSFDKPGYGYQYEISEVIKCLNKNEIQSSKFPLAKSLLLHQTLDRVRKEIGLEY